MRFKLLIGAAVVLLACIGVIVALLLEKQRLANLEATCARISQWARQLPMAVGSYRRCQIPAFLSIPPGSEVNLAKTAQGDIVVLLKTEIGWKQNYEAVLYSTRPVDQSEITPDCYGREEIAIPDIDDGTPLIRKRINPHFFLVYFDLN